MKISKSIQADLALIGITFVWGSTFTIVKQSLAQVSPILFVALRFWVATAITVAIMPGQIRRISGKSLRQGLVLSAVLVGGFIFQTQGLRSTSPSYSAFITSLSVLLVPALGFLLFHHKPRPQTIAGVALATLGLFLLLVNMDDLRIRSGDVLTLVCAIMFAFHILFMGSFVSGTDYRQLQLLQLAGCAVCCTIMAPVLETPFIVWNPDLALYLFITGILATAFALYVQAWAQRLTTANHAALIFSLEPFFAAFFAYWILGQVLTMKEWLGGLMILAGILVSELRITSSGARSEK
jgi:drug/metabolite transporter (DMT)-like permease